MKNLLLTLSLVLVAALCANAQISETEKVMVNGTYNALTIKLADADDKYARKVWENYMKDFSSKTKKVKKSDEYLSEKANIFAIGGTEPLDIYANFEDGSGGANGNFWFLLGDDYLSSYDNEDAYTEAEKFLLKYAVSVKEAQTQDLLEDEEKKLKKLEGSMKGLKKDYDKYVKTIEDSNRKIAQAENDILKNEAEQENTEKMLMEQQEVISGVIERLNELKR